MGEPAGIGTELLFAAHKHFAELPRGKSPSFYLIDDPARVERLARDLHAEVQIATISTPAEAAERFHDVLPVLPIPGVDLDLLNLVEPGRPRPETASAVTRSIEAAIDHIADGKAGGIVTLPIQKEALQQAGFLHPGHTEFLGALTEHLPLPEGFARGPVMLLTAGPFRVVPVTVHMPLRDVPLALTQELILNTTRIVHQAMRRDYGVDAPRLAMAGLNPHAGENGHLGSEEGSIIGPAVETLRSEGIDVVGPLPGDTMFHEEMRAQYHAALCMYHDQALIPIKTIAFYAAVNVTLGLPVVRTSPDHGTALPLVGKGTARPDSLINAIYAAHRMAAARATFAAA